MSCRIGKKTGVTASGSGKKFSVDVPQKPVQYDYFSCTSSNFTHLPSLILYLGDKENHNCQTSDSTRQKCKQQHQNNGGWSRQTGVISYIVVRL